MSCRGREEKPPAPRAEHESRSAPTAEKATRIETAAPAAAGFEALTGRWLRADGGYVLEIWAVSPQGKVEAAYLNPDPIHIARAEASRGKDAVSLIVELRDVNYPGSLYQLDYDPARDVLEGTYFQALEQQTFEVSFVRQ